MSKHRCCCKREDSADKGGRNCGQHEGSSHEGHEHEHEPGNGTVHIEAESTESWDAAATETLRKASESIQGITGIEVDRLSARVEGGKIVGYRVRSRVLFHVE
ncbi:MAG TPA: dodecin family protein [Candidatus Dormibacteraeota bacterium]|nr:dodecin family protein [Candidatus Dormibacteraeota bacterium]